VVSTHIPYALDDHGNNIATATALPTGEVSAAAPAQAPPLGDSWVLRQHHRLIPTTAGATVSGIIGFVDPADVFKISAAAGSLSVQVYVPTAWFTNNRANLDVKLTLMGAAGTVLAIANPAGTGAPLTQLAASLTTTLAAPGTYYLSVSKTGYADPLSTGYSAYGSVGGAPASTSQPGSATDTAWQWPHALC
jgi:hypothetical protein